MNDNMAGVRCWGGVVGIRTKAHKNTEENTNKFPMEKIHSQNCDEKKYANKEESQINIE